MLWSACINELTFFISKEGGFNSLHYWTESLIQLDRTQHRKYFLFYAINELEKQSLFQKQFLQKTLVFPTVSHRRFFHGVFIFVLKAAQPSAALMCSVVCHLVLLSYNLCLFGEKGHCVSLLFMEASRAVTVTAVYIVDFLVS